MSYNVSSDENESKLIGETFDLKISKDSRIMLRRKGKDYFKIIDSVPKFKEGLTLEEREQILTEAYNLYGGK